MVRICLTLIKEGRSNRMDISAAHGSFEQGWGLGSRVDHPSFHPRPFRPAWWAAGPNLQTLAARLLRSSEGPEYRRERLTTPDDDFLDLDWGPEPSANSPIVLVLHGLEGSATRSYVRNVCRELLLSGIQPAALNFRGCSGEANRALHYYHSGKTDDPAFVLSLLRERYPQRRIGALGFSLGGNVLLKMMGERQKGGRELLDAAAVMSVPYDLAAGCKLLEQSPMGHMYAGYFLRSLRNKLRMKEPRLSQEVDLASALTSQTIWEFDDRLTAPLNGFSDAADYYQKSSSAQYLSGIDVPTLLLHAADDPFLPPNSIPSSQASRNPSIALVLQPSGGHVGFLQGTLRRPSFWGDTEAVRFLTEVLTSPLDRR